MENALTDARIEAAICRQFEATSLLIVPIYRERAVAGVLEVLFSEAHTFQDREVRTHELMAGLVEEAMLRENQLRQKGDRAKQSAPVLQSIEQTASQMSQFSVDHGPAFHARTVHVPTAAAETSEVTDAAMFGICGMNSQQGRSPHPPGR